jgi:hypothetical protein
MLIHAINLRADNVSNGTALLTVLFIRQAENAVYVMRLRQNLCIFVRTRCNKILIFEIEQSKESFKVYGFIVRNRVVNVYD